MALRKFLFINGTEGFSEEAAATDSLELGKLTLSGVGGVAIDAGNQLISNVLDPVGNQDAATKAYVDAVAQALVIKDPVKALADANVASLSGPQTIDSVSCVAGDRVLLTAQTAVPFSGTGDSLTFATGTVTLVDAGGAFEAADVGRKITIAGSTNPGNDGTFTIASFVDATTVTFLNASGVTETSSFTYTGEAGIDNGIWVVQTGAWTRPADFAANSNASGAFCFIEQGTSYADTGWVCTTDGPADDVGKDDLAFVQFSAAGTINAGAGLVKVGNTISVKKGDGIEVTSNGAATNVALSVSNPGLALVGTSPNKTLEAAVVSTGGIEKAATGLQLKLNGTTLQTNGSGVSVKGLPSLFEVNGTPVGATVTATALDDITDGGNADAYHTHTMGPAPEAAKVENTVAVSEAVVAGDVAYPTTTNDRYGKGDAANDVKSHSVGVFRTGQSTPGSTAEMVTVGPCASVLSGATAGDIYYLQSGGGIATTLPGAGKRIISVGYAINATDLFVFIRDLGKKAA